MQIPRELRKYDIVLLGANGYTGTLTAEYIVRHLPTNLRWAVAGRSRAKLEALAGKLKSLNPDRVQPGMYPMSIFALHEVSTCIAIEANIGEQISR
jgi:short subunit dehydrogenase-like uncharacterized protein